MSQLPFDDEDYYFQISEELESDKEFILIIYDLSLIHISEPTRP